MILMGNICVSKKNFFLSLLAFGFVSFVLISRFILNQSTSYKSKAAEAKSDLYIIGGHDAKRGAWPFMVIIYNKKLFFKRTPFGPTVGSLRDAFTCGGTLISNEWIVTAAHCLDGEMADKDNIGILLNGYDLSEESAGYPVTVTERIIHEAPHIGTNTDMALLRINNPNPKNEFITPLSYKDMSYTDPGTPVTILGWGRTKANTVLDADSPTILQQAETKITSNEQINKNLISHMIIVGDPSPTYPTPFKTNGISIYSGDSGGPLVGKINGRWYLMGVASSSYVYGGDSTFANLVFEQKWVELVTGIKGGVQ